jgi:hypothetical protein
MIAKEGTLRKRNKRTVVIGQHQISAVTEQILTQMGDEGLIIRQRLEQFFQDRSVCPHLYWQKRLKEPFSS